MPKLQTVEDDSEDSDDFEWEDVEVDQFDDDTPLLPSERKMDFDGDSISITLSGPIVPIPSSKRRAARKPMSKVEKTRRLEAHKAHVLCLLYHSFIRNSWCNDDLLQKTVRKGIPLTAKLVTHLVPDPSAIQLQRSKFFKESLKQILELWRSAFSITEYGISRPHWRDPPRTFGLNDVEAFLDLEDFRSKAKQMSGSADYGAQLFCALLRGMGVETRLVCSLQPLPFAATSTTPVKPPSVITIYAVDSDEEMDNNGNHEQDSPSAPRRISRLGGGRRGRQNATVASSASKIVTNRRRSVARPRHPVFWVEAFDEAYQTWIPIDPMALGNMGKPFSLEPAQNDPDNTLSYVIAFEENGVARDVTRRYAKTYNAKTRKLRVEVTERGIEWFKKAMRIFRRKNPLDRDQLEDAAFIQRDISEGMPRNIEDFKGHPIYVLERHLYRDQVIHPKREVGKVGQNNKVGNSSNLEPVYRRQDVQTVKTAEKWFRLGRKLKEGEMPLKQIKARRGNDVPPDDEAAMAEPSVGVFAQFQTEVYVPPPVKDGRIFKNVFGNIDVYVRSMIPAGAVLVRSQYGKQAARLLGVDYAEAVTGFKFKGRHGTAVIAGVVVAAEYRDAIAAVLEGLAYMRETELEKARLSRVLALWRKFVIGLRIIERVKENDVPSRPGPSKPTIKQREPPAQEVDQGDGGGGFIMDDEPDHPHDVEMAEPDTEPEGGGFMVNEHDDGGGFILDNQVEGGGFMIGDPPEDEGVKRDEPPEHNHQNIPEPTRDTFQTQQETRAPSVPKSVEPPKELSDHDDNDSLLSHDPNEDEEEPDWLD
ncbi:Rad4-domain-containing protein [Microthyrium microscopicum]|uniref:Rad4-domain-containing protein n=1 Tax=Microthyrium microscopicum TaxID=703497 RepID=A0A6A6UEJ9_9PEZI|nr:Rad4-domain-containing protein [Microthyrium microscopicum]